MAIPSRTNREASSTPFTPPWADWALLLGAGILALRPLSITWSDNLNYSFGWWIPLLSAVLFAERWPTRPARTQVAPGRVFAFLAIGGVFFFIFRVVAENDPDWRPGIWVLTTLYVGALIGWLRLYGGVSWVRHFAFPVGFLFLSLPWFYEIEHPLTQGLMRWNAIIVAESLQLLGIFAQPVGNIIQLQNGQLGVEEACSGILSLQASLMMGCLLGEIYRPTIRRRFVLVFAAMGLALVGNYLRTLFLAFIAFYSGSDEVAKWHDTAGYSILVFTAIGTWLTAVALESHRASRISIPAATSTEDTAPRRTRLALRFAMIALGIALLSEAGTQAWYAAKESSLSRHPEWSLSPPAAESYQAIVIPDITIQALRYDNVRAGQWRDAQGWSWSSYWLQYDPKPYTKTVLGWHTPDNCLPSIGLIKDRDYPNFTAPINGIDLYVEPRKFVSKTVTAYVFWVVYPLQGARAADTDTRISLPFATKFRNHLQAVWAGDRGVGVETLETAIIGPSDYEAARAGYLAALKAQVVPGPIREVAATGASH